MTSTAYRTSDEIANLNSLFSNNRPVFLVLCDQIMTDFRTYEGVGMSINTRRLKNAARDMLAKHLEEYPDGLPHNLPTYIKSPQLRKYNKKKAPVQ